MRFLLLASCDHEGQCLPHGIATLYRYICSHAQEAYGYVFSTTTPWESETNTHCRYIALEGQHERMAACANLAEDLQPDVICLYASLLDAACARLVRRFPNTVLLLPDCTDPNGLGQANSYILEPLSACLGVAGSRETLARYRQCFPDRDIPCCYFTAPTPEGTAAQLLEFCATVTKPVKVAPPRPFVSAVVPCYKQGHLLPESIVSLAAQNFSDMEVIIVNDGSPDDTSTVAHACMERYPALHIRLVEQRNKGLSGARNAGVAEAKGQWILCIDSDDHLAENFLHAAHHALQENHHTNLICGMIRRWGAQTSDWFPFHYSASYLPFENSITGAAMFRRSLWESVNGHDSSHPWGIEDWHFWLKCREVGLVVLALQTPLLHYRIHETDSMYTTMMNYWPESVAMHRTMLPNTYNPAQVIAAHTQLFSLSDDSLTRIHKKIQQHPQLFYPLLWLGLWHEGRQEYDQALPYYLRLQHCADKGVRWQGLYRLALVYAALGLTQKSIAMQQACITLQPLVALILEDQHQRAELVRTQGAEKKRILLLGEGLPPPPGEREPFLSILGRELIKNGYDVHIVAKYCECRSSLDYNGMHIHQFANYGDTARGIPDGLDDLDVLLDECGFQAVVIAGQPAPWTMYVCACPAPRARVVYIPTLSVQDITKHLTQGTLADIMGFISKADVLCAMSERGPAMQLLQCAGKTPQYTPPMIPAPQITRTFREHFSLPSNISLFAHVADFHPEAEHDALIKQMQKLHGDWRCVFMGARHSKEVAASVKAAIAGDPHYIMVENPPHDIALSLVQDADVLLTTFCDDICFPVLEAMSCGTPWLATPQCRAVVGLAGGFPVYLQSFPRLLLALDGTPSLREALGNLGKEHWQRAFSTQAVFPTMLALIEGNKAALPDMSMPKTICEAQAVLWKRISELS